jgi:hypothetical protein
VQRSVPRARRHVSSEHDVRIEYREQRLEVTAAGGREKGVDSFPLAGEIGVGNRAAPDRRRGRLASCRTGAGERPKIGAISSKDTSNMSCSTNASRSWG